MRILLVVSMFLFSVAAIAAADQVGSITFGPKAGKMVYQTELQQTDGEYTYQANTTSADVSKYETSGLENAHQFWYAFTDTTYAGLKLSYAFSNETENTSVPAGSTKIKDTNNKGLGDIGFLGNHSFNDNINMDFGLSISPGDAETAQSNTTVASKDGNNYSGGHNLSLGVNYVLPATSDFELNFNANGTYYFSRTEKVLAYSGTTETKNKYDPTLDLGLVVTGEYTFSKMLAALHVGYTMQGKSKYDSVNAGTTTKYDAKSIGYWDMGLDGKYLFSKDMYLGAKLGMKMYDDQKETSTVAGVATEAKYKDYSETYYGVNFGIQF